MQAVTADLAGLSGQSLAEIEQYGQQLTEHRFGLFTLYSPDIYSLLFIVIVACIRRAWLSFALRRRALDRVRGAVAARSGKAGDALEVEQLTAVAQYERRIKALFGHVYNLVLGTVMLGLQLASYDYLQIPFTNFSIRQTELAWVLAKLLLLTYSCELLFGDHIHGHIVFHHLATFWFVFVELIATYTSLEVRWLCLFLWFVWEASAEQPTYLAMAFYHGSDALHLLDVKPGLQRGMLRLSARLLRFNCWYSIPQKLVPIFISLYWLHQVWSYESSYSAFTRFALAWSLLAIIALLFIQIWFIEQNWAIHASIGGKAFDKRFEHHSPVFRLLMRLISRWRPVEGRDESKPRPDSEKQHAEKDAENSERQSSEATVVDMGEEEQHKRVSTRPPSVQWQPTEQEEGWSDSMELYRTRSK